MALVTNNSDVQDSHKTVGAHGRDPRTTGDQTFYSRCGGGKRPRRLDFQPSSHLTARKSATKTRRFLVCSPYRLPPNKGLLRVFRITAPSYHPVITRLGVEESKWRQQSTQPYRQLC
eukprot:4256418-Pyramimonas_sp.AAC.1